MPIRSVVSVAAFVVALSCLTCAPATAEETPEELAKRAFSILGLENLEGGLTTDPSRIAEGLPLLRQAAEAGDGLSQNALGMAYANGLFGLEVDMDKAIALYEDAMDHEVAGPVARLNWALTQFYVGDAKLAVARLEEIHASGSELAPATAATLATAYAFGEGVAEDLPRAGALYLEAVQYDPSDSQSHYMLGRGYEAGFFDGGSPALALEHYLAAAELGDPRAAWKIGMAHLQGARGFDGGSAEAYAWVRRSAEGGWIDGMISTAVMLATGDGVARDPIAAAAWYTKAATRGSAHAMRGLGAMHYFRELSDGDKALGLALIELGAERGDESARSILAGIESDARRIDRDEVERFKVEWRRRVAAGAD